MNINPFTRHPTFDLDFKMSPVALVKFNDFARAYAHFDFEKGTLTLASELAAIDGQFKGYLKPLFDQVDIVDLKENIKNPVKLVWEGLIGAVAKVFRNQPKKRFATKIPLEGRVDDTKAQVLPMIGNIFRNAFVKVYGGEIENIIQLESGKKE